MKKNILYLLFGFVAFAFSACTNGKNEVGTSGLRVRLTDAPGDYEAVFIDIQGLEVKAADTPDESGWVIMNDVHKGIYDLLQLTNGIDTLIGTTQLPSGKLSQIRLILGEKNSVVIDGKSHSLQTPSGQSSGLKIPVNMVLQDGITYTIALDFDASRSIVQAGQAGKYILKPVIRPIVKSLTGAIKGTVSPESISTAVYAISGQDTVGTFTNATGQFMLNGLEAGAYSVVLLPSGSHDKKTIEDVRVTLGNVTVLGNITLE